MEDDIAVLLTELIEKVGLLRRDLKQKGDLEKYEGRLARIDQKFSALAEKISETDPEAELPPLPPVAPPDSILRKGRDGSYCL
jgi:hypothetical protein